MYPTDVPLVHLLGTSVSEWYICCQRYANRDMPTERLTCQQMYHSERVIPLQMYPLFLGDTSVCMSQRYANRCTTEICQQMYHSERLTCHSEWVTCQQMYHSERVTSYRCTTQKERYANRWVIHLLNTSVGISLFLSGASVGMSLFLSGTSTGILSGTSVEHSLPYYFPFCWHISLSSTSVGYICWHIWVVHLLGITLSDVSNRCTTEWHPYRCQDRLLQMYSFWCIQQMYHSETEICQQISTQRHATQKEWHTNRCTIDVSNRYANRCTTQKKRYANRCIQQMFWVIHPIDVRKTDMPTDVLLRKSDMPTDVPLRKRDMPTDVSLRKRDANRCSS